MINTWWLLLIVPVSFLAGVITATVCRTAKRRDETNSRSDACCGCLWYKEILGVPFCDSPQNTAPDAPIDRPMVCTRREPVETEEKNV